MFEIIIAVVLITIANIVGFLGVELEVSLDEKREAKKFIARKQQEAIDDIAKEFAEDSKAFCYWSDSYKDYLNHVVGTHEYFMVYSKDFDFSDDPVVKYFEAKRKIAIQICGLTEEELDD